MAYHTFGGSLLSRFIDYEATEGSGDPGGVAPAAADVGAEPAPAATPPSPGGDAEGAPSSGEPAAPTWAPSQDEWEALQEQNRQLVEWAQAREAAAAEPQQQGQPTLEQLAAAYEQAGVEGDFQTQFLIQNELSRRAIADAMGPMQPTLQAVRDQQSEQIVNTWLTDLKVPDEDREFVTYLAHGFVPRDDNGDVLPGHGQQAAAQAAQQLAERDKRVAAAAVEAYKQELTAVSGAPRDATGGVPGVVDESTPSSLGDVVRSFMERQAAGRAA